MQSQNPAPQKTASRPVTGPAWEPIGFAHQATRLRVRAGTLASRRHARMVTTILIKEAKQPHACALLIYPWMRVADQRFVGSDKGIIGQMAADMGLPQDLCGPALCRMKRHIDDGASHFGNARSMHKRSENEGWDVILADVHQILEEAFTQVGKDIVPREVSEAIGDLISRFGTALESSDWQGCCETMAQLDQLVSSELVETPAMFPGTPGGEQVAAEEQAGRREIQDRREAIGRLQGLEHPAAQGIAGHMQTHTLTQATAAASEVGKHISSLMAEFPEVNGSIPINKRRELLHGKIDTVQTACDLHLPHLSLIKRRQFVDGIAVLKLHAAKGDMQDFLKELSKFSLGFS
ncbi:hypothetical protein [Rhizobacter sp. SG703]|uniref:hypothetical protein n=1 Tax=Rhizobacter sp. SG703 TaxID=2587140 RepID=UPI001444E5FB|nr:hypothetical protein [Rhizobacter sp. SG703]NKI97312.1 hypothetical protein [Rhizobacter sp. SG703]